MYLLRALDARGKTASSRPPSILRSILSAAGSRSSVSCQLGDLRAYRGSFRGAPEKEERGTGQAVRARVTSEERRVCLFFHLLTLRGLRIHQIDGFPWFFIGFNDSSTLSSENTSLSRRL
jgi:hypothetical protein